MKSRLLRWLASTGFTGLLISNGASLVQAAEVEKHYHLDSVGTVRTVTDKNGNVLERFDYHPFGEDVATPTTTNTRRFAGKERDAETAALGGFDYLGARYYFGRIARFTTVDPVHSLQDNLVDPQRWNRYAYGRNNPLRYVDPDGRVVIPAAVIIGGAVAYALLASPDIANAPGPTDPTFRSDQSGKLIANAAIGVIVFKRLFGAEVLSPPDQRDATRRLGDLTDAETQQIQGVVDRAGRPLEVVGSAAEGTRRGMGTGLPIGKGPGTQSDIDYLIPPGSRKHFEGLEGQLPGIDPEGGAIPGTHNPHVGPAVRFEPHQEPRFIPKINE